jgi:mannan endo-1,4-beta-mannosidase
MRFSASLAAAVVSLYLSASAAPAAEPVNPDLIPEARAVLDYLASVYGKRTLSGVSGTKNAPEVDRISGKHPAIVAVDISGWNSPTWGPSYTRVVDTYVDQAKQWWADRGIVTMQFHWKHPGKPDGTSWVGKHGRNPPSGPFDLAKAVQEGTQQHKQVMRDLSRTGDCLQRLLDARVPVLFRPLHEMDGGWFWWTGCVERHGSATWAGMH